MKRLFAWGMLVSIAVGMLHTAPAYAQIGGVTGTAVPTEEVPWSPLSIAATSQTHLSFFEWAQKFVLSTLKKRILDFMVDQIVQWIQGGGSPKFVTDWQSFLLEAGNQAAGDFAKEIGAGFLCDPFAFKVQLGLLPVQKFAKQAQCTLDKIVGNINNFYNNFSNGSWIAYNTAWQPQNNYFGAYLMASTELDRRVSRASNAAYAEAQAGNGFLSTKTCAKDVYGKDIPSTCVITTPGTTIGSLAADAVGSDLKFILSSNEISQYVASISNALINRLIVSGVSGLQGLSTPNAPQSGSIPTSTTGNCAGLSGATLTACTSYTSSNNANAAGTLADSINQSLAPRQTAETAYADAITQLHAYLASLNSFQASFAPLTCSVHQVTILNLQTELAWASSTLALVQNQRAANLTAIATLLAAQQQLQTIAPNDFQAYANLAASLGAVNNPGAAQAEQAQAISARNQVTDRAAANNSTFSQALSNCQNGG